MDAKSERDLLGRIRNGDRDAAAQFLIDHSKLIKRRIRGRLSPALRSVFGSDDVISTVGRRLDDFVRKGMRNLQSEDELHALVMRMAMNAVVDHGRIVARLRRVEGSEEVFARQMLRHLENSAPKDDVAGFTSAVERALNAHRNDIDRKILWMWLMDWKLKDIATALNMSAPAVRERWRRIKERLRPLLESER